MPVGAKDGVERALPQEEPLNEALVHPLGDGWMLRESAALPLSDCVLLPLSEEQVLALADGEPPPVEGEGAALPVARVLLALAERWPVALKLVVPHELAWAVAVAQVLALGLIVAAAEMLKSLLVPLSVADGEKGALIVRVAAGRLVELGEPHAEGDSDAEGSPLCEDRGVAQASADDDGGAEGAPEAEIDGVTETDPPRVTEGAAEGERSAEEEARGENVVEADGATEAVNEGDDEAVPPREGGADADSERPPDDDPRRDGVAASDTAPVAESDTLGVPECEPLVVGHEEGENTPVADAVEHGEGGAVGERVVAALRENVPVTEPVTVSVMSGTHTVTVTRPQPPSPPPPAPPLPTPAT